MRIFCDGSIQHGDINLVQANVNVSCYEQSRGIRISIKANFNLFCNFTGHKFIIGAECLAETRWSY